MISQNKQNQSWMIEIRKDDKSWEIDREKAQDNFLVDEIFIFIGGDYIENIQLPKFIEHSDFLIYKWYLNTENI